MPNSFIGTMLTLAVIALLPVSSAAQVRPLNESLLPQSKIIPIDEATKDPPLVHMRAQLMNALHVCDPKAVLALANPDVELGAAWKDFEGDFRDLLTGPKRDAHLCAEMFESLTLGGLLRDRDTFESNYVALQFKGDIDRVYPDRTTYRVITGKDVPVFARPSSSSPIIWRLSYDVALVRINGTNRVWQQVEYSDKKFGFVDSKYVSDPGGLVVKIHRERTGWKISGLTAFYE